MICRNCGKEISDKVCKIHEPWCFENNPQELIIEEIKENEPKAALELNLNDPEEFQKPNDRLIELQEEAIRLKIASPSVVRRWKNISTIEQKIASI